MSTTETKTVPLYGGAFSIDIPSRFEDVSGVREVPNHQEVFVDGDTDQSIIVELNSVTELPDTDAIAFMWKDLMEADGSSEHTIHTTGYYPLDNIPGVAGHTTRVTFIDGSHWVSKFKENNPNNIRTYLLNVRLESVDTDLLLIFNIPLELNEHSSSGHRPIMAPDAANEMVTAVIRSFKINNLSIFK